MLCGVLEEITRKALFEEACEHWSLARGFSSHSNGLKPEILVVCAKARALAHGHRPSWLRAVIHKLQSGRTFIGDSTSRFDDDVDV
jgi:hypothetical protein